MTTKLPLAPRELPAIHIDVFDVDAKRVAAREYEPARVRYQEAAARLNALIEDFASHEGAYLSAELRAQIRAEITAVADAAQAAADHDRDVKAHVPGAKPHMLRQQLADALTRVSAGLDAADQHAALLDAHAKRRAILDANKADGLPWHVGLTPDLLTARDLQALERDPGAYEEVLGRSPRDATHKAWRRATGGLPTPADHFDPVAAMAPAPKPDLGRGDKIHIQIGDGVRGQSARTVGIPDLAPPQREAADLEPIYAHQRATHGGDNV